MTIKGVNMARNPEAGVAVRAEKRGGNGPVTVTEGGSIKGGGAPVLTEAGPSTSLAAKISLDKETVVR